MDAPADTTGADLDAARAAYRQAEDALVVIANRVWVDGQSTVDGLLDIAEEHGADEAIMRILESPERFSPVLGTVTDSSYADVSETVEALLKDVVAAQDRLDEATARREAVLRSQEPGRLPVVDFSGRPFFIDERRGELRSVDDPAERYRLPEEVRAKDAPAPAKPSLTEKLAKEAGIEPVKPNPQQNKTRSR